MYNELKDSGWYNDIDGQWELFTTEGRLLAILKKVKYLWYGKVIPNKKDHLPPSGSLSMAMKKAEDYIRQRSEVLHGT